MPPAKPRRKRPPKPAAGTLAQQLRRLARTAPPDVAAWLRAMAKADQQSTTAKP